ncbi:MAG TPA: hypothetical protein VFS10_02980 [Pyrinomonadaceae bacterium]|nr:hypothetical protein [Pyrinomonadaceae bacterium]
MLTIRRAEESDFDALREIFRRVVAGGDAFAFDEGQRASKGSWTPS